MNIEAYIDSKKFAWAPSTIRSEEFRLKGVADFLDGNPETLWRAIQEMKPYARQTLWTRIIDFWSFFNPNKENPYDRFRKTNARLFKNVYVRTKPDLSYEEAKLRISRITNDVYRNRAIQILESGLRFEESNHINRDGTVSGKGGKIRNVFTAPSDTNISYFSFYRALKAVGLKPHDLRKLFLSRLVELGANEFELCSIAGWSNINTASSYIKTNPNRLTDLVKKARG